MSSLILRTTLIQCTLMSFVLGGSLFDFDYTNGDKTNSDYSSRDNERKKAEEGNEGDNGVAEYSISEEKVSGTVPVYSWLHKLRADRKGSGLNIRLPDTGDLYDTRPAAVSTKRPRVEVPLYDVDKLNGLVGERRGAENIMDGIDEFAREFQRKWHMDPTQGKFVNLKRSTRNDEAAEKSSLNMARDVQKIHDMLNFDEDVATAAGSEVRPGPALAELSETPRSAAECKLHAAQSAQPADDGQPVDEPADALKTDQLHEHTDTQSLQAKTDVDGNVAAEKPNQHVEKVATIHSATGDEESQELTDKVAAEESPETSDNEKLRKIADLGASHVKKVLGPQAGMPAEVHPGLSVAQQPNEDASGDNFLLSNSRDPPRYIIKVRDGYISSENGKYLQKLTADRVPSDSLLNLEDQQQPQQEHEQQQQQQPTPNAKTEARYDCVREKREYKKYNDASNQVIDENYLRQLEESFPRDRGDREMQVPKQLKQHTRIKRTRRTTSA